MRSRDAAGHQILPQSGHEIPQTAWDVADKSVRINSIRHVRIAMHEQNSCRRRRGTADDHITLGRTAADLPQQEQSPEPSSFRE